MAHVTAVNAAVVVVVVVVVILVVSLCLLYNRIHFIFCLVHCHLYFSLRKTTRSKAFRNIFATCT